MSLFKVDNFTESLKVFKKDFPFNSSGDLFRHGGKNNVAYT